VHREPWSKVSVVLMDRQILGLDQLVQNVRRNTRRALNRTVIIRALIDALFDSSVDVSSARSEAEVRRTILKRLRNGNNNSSN
jgi:hypothetical protein